jgi:hypothetical protein
MKQFIRKIWYPALAVLLFALSVALLILTSIASDWHDFDVFYDAGTAALVGRPIYAVVGQYNLPFWYPPWTAWLFIPFAVWPRHLGLLLYQATSAISALLALRYLTRLYDPAFRVLDELVIVALLIPMSLQLVLVGQMDYIILGLLALIIWAAAHKKDVLGGMIFPFLLAKPHLIVPFTLLLFWRLGKRGLLVAGFTSIVLLVAATILSPGWYFQMFDLLQASGNRTAGLAFTTFPSLLGGQENWIGTGNLLFTFALVCAAILVLWRFRGLSTVPLLSLALSLSLFCAPRAYAYDLPLHIPALVWLTSGRFRSTVWLWLVAGFFPLAVGFSSAAYLVTLAVCVLGVRKAALETSRVPQFSIPG